MPEPLNLKKILSEIFNYPEEKISDADSPESISGWDSFQSLIMFQELERVSGASFAIDDLKDIKNVGDVQKLLDKYKIIYKI